MLVKNTRPNACQNVITLTPKITGNNQFHNNISGHATNNAIIPPAINTVKTTAQMTKLNLPITYLFI